MPRLFSLPRFCDARGSLAVLDAPLPFPIRRVFFLYGIAPGATRGGHRHRRTRQALVCAKGSCRARVSVEGGEDRVYRLDDPTACLLLDPGDWCELLDFSPDAVVAVLASEPFDPADILDETPR